MSEVIGNPPRSAPGNAPAIAQDNPDGHVTATRRLLRRLVAAAGQRDGKQNNQRPEDAG